MKHLLIYFILPGIFLFPGIAGGKESATQKETVTIVIPLPVSVEGSTKPVPEFVAALAKRLNQVTGREARMNEEDEKVTFELSEYNPGDRELALLKACLTSNFYIKYFDLLEYEEGNAPEDAAFVPAWLGEGENSESAPLVFVRDLPFATLRQKDFSVMQITRTNSPALIKAGLKNKNKDLSTRTAKLAKGPVTAKRVYYTLSGLQAGIILVDKEEKTDFSFEVADPLTARMLEMQIRNPLPFEIKMPAP